MSRLVSSTPILPLNFHVSSCPILSRNYFISPVLSQTVPSSLCISSIYNLVTDNLTPYSASACLTLTFQFVVTQTVFTFSEAILHSFFIFYICQKMLFVLLLHRNDFLKSIITSYLIMDYHCYMDRLPNQLQKPRHEMTYVRSK